MLTNVLRQTEAHNRRMEERKMWEDHWAATTNDRSSRSVRALDLHEDRVSTKDSFRRERRENERRRKRREAKNARGDSLGSTVGSTLERMLPSGNLVYASTGASTQDRWSHDASLETELFSTTDPRASRAKTGSSSSEEDSQRSRKRRRRERRERKKRRDKRRRRRSCS